MTRNSDICNSASDLTAGLNFTTGTIINSPINAASQIDRALDTMLYECKPVYIGIAPAVAGVVIAVPAGRGTASAAQRTSSVSGEHLNAAGAGEF